MRLISILDLGYNKYIYKFNTDFDVDIIMNYVYSLHNLYDDFYIGKYKDFIINNKYRKLKYIYTASLGKESYILEFYCIIDHYKRLFPFYVKIINNKSLSVTQYLLAYNAEDIEVIFDNTITTSIIPIYKHFLFSSEKMFLILDLINLDYDSNISYYVYLINKIMDDFDNYDINKITNTFKAYLKFDIECDYSVDSLFGNMLSVNTNNIQYNTFVKKILLNNREEPNLVECVYCKKYFKYYYGILGIPIEYLKFEIVNGEIISYKYNNIFYPKIHDENLMIRYIHEFISYVTNILNIYYNLEFGCDSSILCIFFYKYHL